MKTMEEHLILSDTPIIYMLMGLYWLETSLFLKVLRGYIVMLLMGVQT